MKSGGCINAALDGNNNSSWFPVLNIRDWFFNMFSCTRCLAGGGRCKAALIPASLKKIFLKDGRTDRAAAPDGL